MLISRISFTDDIRKCMGFLFIVRDQVQPHFHFIVQKLEAKLTARKGSLLNFARRITLAQSVLSAILVYFKQSTLLRIGICEEPFLDSLIRLDMVCIWLIRRILLGQKTLYFADLMPSNSIEDQSLLVKDCILYGSWNLNHLAFLNPKMVRLLTQGVPFPHLFQGPDGSIWGSAEDGAYSAKAVYKWLASNLYSPENAIWGNI